MRWVRYEADGHPVYGIVEGEEASSALAKLREALETNLPDPEERRRVEPRLAHLLGLEEPVTREREDMFAYNCVHLGGSKVLEAGPSQVLVGPPLLVIPRGEYRVGDGFLQSARAVLREGM